MFTKATRVVFRILLVIIILNMTGGQWFVLQTFAWSQMIVSYSHNAPIKQAIQETFDGQHPCNLCKDIQQAKQSEKKQEMRQIVLKRNFVFELHQVLFSPPQHGWFQIVTDSFPLVRNQSPTVPPPRSLFA